MTGVISNSYVSKLRYILAACMISICQILFLIMNITDKGLLYIICNMILEIIIVTIVFGKLKLKKYVYYISLHMLIMFLMGGIVTAIYDRFINYRRGDVSFVEFILIGIVIFVLIKYTLPIILKYFFYKERIYEVKIKLKGKETKIKALLDTGNSLIEPTTGKKVTIVEKKIIRVFDDVHIDKIFIVPYKSLGKENGVLYGIEVDELVIKYEKYEKRITKAIIGIYNGNLSKDNRYSAILHCEILV